ncbi:transcription-repair coupling factor [Acetivibrio mesophilus]|uniref:Transcription-repair-coupling factor n=1 Tax=Acetivibrio mesophilus TaxID=2487273 RepID=A0A4Q0I511_9FIRM|nr:transcription-repair coupling factor [Acetivibrio mesophilus]ODM27443.1 transcription-repair coupling factor [Clostridium sp. Bc-iso-3]RXE59403.1 transcription-repair coupling factor [Acetivibrio mesophilus]
MSILKDKQYLVEPLFEIKEYTDVLENIKRGIPTTLTGPSESQKVHVACGLCCHLGLKGIYIAFNEMQARKMFEDISFFFGRDAVFFPSKEIMLHDVEAKSYDSVYERISALYRIVNDDYSFIVTSAEALCQKLIDKQLFKESIISLALGDRIDLGLFTQKLVSIGYERVTTVEGKSQFAVRGGIIDIFPVNSDTAVRIELFDDEIDSVRSFDTMTQRSMENHEGITVLPARELIYPLSLRDSILEKISYDLKEQIKKMGGKNSKSQIEKLEAKIGSDIERFEQEYYFAGMDRYIPYIIEKPSIITEYIGSEILTFVDEPKRFEQRLETLLMESNEMCKSFMENGQLLAGSFDIFFDYNHLWERLEKSKNTLYLSTLPSNDEERSKRENIASKLLNSYQGHLEILAEDINHWKKNHARVVILSGTKSRGEMLAETLRTKDIEAVYMEEPDREIQPGEVIITHGILNRGFEYPGIGFVVVSGKELFGQDKKLRKHKSTKGQKISVFTDLNVGDYVVHQLHGIGKYVGIQQLVVENIKKDYLKIQYNEGDYLYVPTNQLDLIQKYIGSEGKAPKLSKLGGTDWVKTRAKAKESLKELAEELINLYAQREAATGHSFGKDTVWQKQFEELFPYQETEDQLKCIEEIKKDMESSKPMDRLLCGDVGYGKTEVAMRAVFKAVMDGKQVAYLVPTTVLAQQQYNTFKERMKDFPITVEMISRFRTQAEQKKILKDVKTGMVDVLVGTHRLLQKDISFKDLGLLVIDEEQRFGVTHKEKIKSLKANIDVLTLTATPIPRTLHMSLVGIRDISTIEDPPEERYPVQTYVMEYNNEVVREAITREMSRGGQVFYLYNRVRTINLKAAEIQKLVPEARVGTAHGQMNETELENIMFQFINGEYDVLVCTTIIESGLDMPNVNTIIVEDADRMGLAQLYQLRGRVGRSNRLAYAYITYKKDKVLSEIAEKRLQAIKEFTEFGSGFKIAMRDLQIRGAGNLLGPQQHGHIDSVGYDMYCKLLAEAVNELRGMPAAEEEEEISIDINVSAYIDNDYISDENQKIDMYKKIASINDEQDVLDTEDELMDRYGEIPQPVGNLLKIAYIKSLSKACGFSSLQEKNDAVILQYSENRNINFEALGKLMDKYRRKLLFTASNRPYITFKTTGVKREELLEIIKILLQDIKKLQ